MNEIKYSEEELLTISKVINSKQFSSISWSDEKLKSIRKRIKDHYLEEQNFTCFFCQQKNRVKHNRAWDTEHLISRSAHPKFMFDPKNLCITCIDCNTEKNDANILSRPSSPKRLPRSSNAYKTVHPHFDNYEDHIKVIEAGCLYRQITSKGRHTIRVYGLDRYLAISGRSGDVNSNPALVKLLAKTINPGPDSDMIELQVLIELLLKRSEKIGEVETLTLIKKIHETF